MGNGIREMSGVMNHEMRARSEIPRVILFDIDGTLIRTVRRNGYRSRIRAMMKDVFGTAGGIERVDFSGKTDLAIYREALEPHGIRLDQIRACLPELETATVEILMSLASDGPVFEVLNGVSELLEELTGDERFIPSLLTGNVERLAEAKLEVAGLRCYFGVRGAFGSDAEDRNDLPAIAASRISRHLDRTLGPNDFVIVGDTPRDIACARHFGCRVLAVASGMHSIEDLAALEPDFVVPHLEKTDEIIRHLSAV